MAGSSPVDNFWATFSELRRILYRKILLLSIVLIPFVLQTEIIGSLIELKTFRSCNASESCWYVNSTAGTGDVAAKPTEINFAKQSTILYVCHFVGMFFGALILGPVADLVGRSIVLLPVSFAALVAALLSAFFLKHLVVFTVLRFFVGFSSGGALLVIFILTAEYVDPTLRALALAAMWIFSSVSCFILIGLIYLIQDQRSLFITTSCPLALAIILWKFIPESPRWLLLNTRRTTGEEAQTLLQRYVGDKDQRLQSKYGICSKMWGRVQDQPPSREVGFTFLRRREARKTTAVIAFTWFACGLMYSGLNHSSIQILSTFYSNFAIRELVNLPAILTYLVLGSWCGRRLTILIGMLLCGLFCVGFSVASHSMLVSVHSVVAMVIQLVGRMFLVVSLSSITLYSVELFPTTVRCAALGFVLAVGCIGAAVAPPLVKSLPRQPVIPLGIMGLVTMVAGVLCRCLLPETKGTFTTETYDDHSEMIQFRESWSPKVSRRKTRDSTDLMQQDAPMEKQDTHSEAIDISTKTDEFEDLRQSWEVSFDRASRTSRWEMLSYEDAKQGLLSVSIDQSLSEESQLLSDDDLYKLSRHVPSATWILVYSTFLHGMSLKTLYSRCAELETPVMIVIKDDNDFVFGVLSPRPPKVDPSFSGFGKSYFFRLRPEFNVYPCSGKNSYYMMGENRGLAFGCSEGQFGLWLDADLYHGRSTACQTYNSEMMSATEDFLCLGLEAWTFG